MSLRVKIGVSIGVVVAAALLASAALFGSAQRGAAQISRILTTGQFLDQLRMTQPELVRLLAYVQLVRGGDGTFRDEVTLQLRVVREAVTRLEPKTVGALSARQWGLLKQAQADWQECVHVIEELQRAGFALPPERLLELSQTLSRRSAGLQRGLELLHQESLARLKQESAFMSLWPGLILRRGVVLAVILAVLAILISMPWALALRRTSEQLRRAAQVIAAGNLAYRLPRGSDDELGELVSAVNTVTETLERAQGAPPEILRQREALQERERQLADVQIRVEQMARAHRTAQDEIEDVKRRTADRERALEEARQTIARLEEDLGRTGADLTHRQGELLQTQALLATTQDQLTAAQTEARQMQQALARAQQTIAQLEGERGALQADLTRRQGECLQLQTTATATQESLAASQAQQQQTRQALTEKTQALAQQQQALAEKTQAFTRAQQTIAKLEDARDTLRAELEQRDRDLAAMQAKLAPSQESLAAAHAEAERLTQALADKTQALAEAQQAVSKLQGRLGKQQAELTRLTTTARLH